MRYDRLGSTVLYYHLPLHVALGTITLPAANLYFAFEATCCHKLPCASAAQGDCSNPSPSKDLKQNKSQTSAEITAVVKGRCSQRTVGCYSPSLFQTCAFAYITYCLHSAISLYRRF